ncbi:hypothetical protein [Paenibacillus dauci]|uniref:hypothetical protein n=1 Tax=Paenibacillus dauci TaxID=1567106 RepID=UPI000AF827F7|nr:hypothetical protein [Paenibacillus dauci]
MKIEDYDGMIALWQHTAGMKLSAADSRESIQRYLGAPVFGEKQIISLSFQKILMDNI